MDAFRNVPGTHGCEIDWNGFVVLPNRRRARFITLEVMDGTVDLEDVLLSEPCLLELAINVGGDNEAIETKTSAPVKKE